MIEIMYSNEFQTEVNEKSAWDINEVNKIVPLGLIIEDGKITGVEI